MEPKKKNNKLSRILLTSERLGKPGGAAAGRPGDAAAARRSAAAKSGAAARPVAATAKEADGGGLQPWRACFRLQQHAALL